MAHMLRTIALPQIGEIRGLVQERENLLRLEGRIVRSRTQRNRLEEEQGRSLRQGQFSQGSCGKGWPQRWVGKQEATEGCSCSPFLVFSLATLFFFFFHINTFGTEPVNITNSHENSKSLQRLFCWSNHCPLAVFF